MAKENNKKIIASFELTLMFLSMFAFTYMVSQTNEYFGATIKEENNNLSLFSSIKAIWSILINKVKSPIIPFVSASEDIGCCQLTKSGAVCVTSAESDCQETFVTGAVCDDVSYCTTGCCYEPSTGHYTENTINSLCTSEEGEWTSGSCQSLPGARTGCCVIGDSTITSITEKECDLQSEALGFEVPDFRLGMGELQCILLAESGDMGACVDSEKSCTFASRSQCPNSNDFYKDYLCTAPTLETTCEKQTLGEYKTTCVDGKDEVYFMDSCGNRANVYDASKINNIPYWTTIQEPTCTVSGSNGEAANDPDCGNCNRYAGGICSSADEDGFDVSKGQYYCQDMGCKYDYNLDGAPDDVKNGESWCMYDGMVGNGDDIVGSSHWKYECSQGEVIASRCGDELRNSICIDYTNKLEEEGVATDFKLASCVPNTWRKCIAINSEFDDEDEIVSECNSFPGCEVKEVNLDNNYFSFSICTPKYPAGFDLGNPNTAASNAEQCGMITVDCEVPRQPEFGSGCEYAEDEDGNEDINKVCLTQEFTNQMNELCRSMGDCGFTTNIAGQSDQGFLVSYDLSDMSDSEVMDNEDQLKAKTKDLNSTNRQRIEGTSFNSLSNPTYQTIWEDYTDIISGSGLSLGDLEGNEYMDENWTHLTGVIVSGGIAVAIALGTGIAGAIGGASGIAPSILAGLGAAGAAGPALGVVIGAAIGVAIALLLADSLGFSETTTIWLSISLGLVGAGLGLAAGATAAGVTGTLFSIGTVGITVPVLGWIIAGVAAVVAIIFTVIGLGEDDCEPITITYACQSYEQPIGGDDCHLCNDELSDNGLRECTDYRCESLGAACKIINRGTKDEKCAAIPNDGIPPIILSEDLSKDNNIEAASSGANFAELKPKTSSCFDAYETITLGVGITEPAKCKFSTIQESYEDMDKTFGTTSLLTNQSMDFFIPDPSNGQSQGLNWQGDMEFYIKCQDAYGDVSPEFFKFNFCVNEGQDTRAPMIEKFKPENGGLSSFDLDEQNVTLTTNEPAQCRWSTSDVAYDSMPNRMECGADYPETTWTRPFQCTTTLPTPDAENTFYINCKDQPWLAEDSTDRNSKYENEVYVLNKPEKKIEIDWIEPNEDIETGSQLQSIDLRIKTSGGGKYHMCKWSMSGFTTMFDLPLGSNKGNTHSIPLNLAPGHKTVYVNCSDETGDTTSASSSFEIKYDSRPPEVTRIWQESGKLHLITDETGECRYSIEDCNFDWEEAPIISGNYEYIIPVVRGQRYYIKCEDEYGNHPSISCSAEVMAV